MLNDSYWKRETPSKIGEVLNKNEGIALVMMGASMLKGILKK